MSPGFSTRFKTAVAGLALSLTLGCIDPPPVDIGMELWATNSADRILVVEGKTDLPGGALLTATVKDADGKVFLRDQAVVHQGRFFFDFDLANLTGLNLYQVWVEFDPLLAPPGVRQVIGFRGQSMQGMGVMTEDDRRILKRHLDVMLTTADNWNARDFVDMSERERDRVIRELERMLEGKPDDRTIMLSLAKGYIAADPREIAGGSRAHMLLKDASLAPKPDEVSKEAKVLLGGIEKKEKGKQQTRQQRQAAAKGFKYYKNKEVTPGRSLGGFVLGTPYDAIARHFKVQKNADFATAKKDVVVTLKEIPGVRLTFSRTSRRLIRARTSSPKYVLREGFRVGSLLQELQEAYGKDVVPNPKFRKPTTGSDGTQYYRGKVLTNGLQFEIVKVVDPVFGLPVDKVEAISVFKP